VTESVLLTEVEMASGLIEALSARGFRLAIDDFGTGYSSLSHLLELPVGHLKIDRGFIREFATSHKHQALVRGIISIAEGLGLGTVAEGVESAEEVERLRELGCRQLQGYFISAALPAREALTFETDAATFERQGELFAGIDATPTSIAADFARSAEWELDIEPGVSASTASTDNV
jgi:EAL domain-containing protein (putative c-di-GMP-specific phosphodiesterase class I)